MKEPFKEEVLFFDVTLVLLDYSHNAVQTEYIYEGQTNAVIRHWLEILLADCKIDPFLFFFLDYSSICMHYEASVSKFWTLS